MWNKFRVLLKRIYFIVLPIIQRIVVFRLRHKKMINVVFFAMSLPMWRHQRFYESLKKNPRFNAYIVILPSNTYTQDQQLKDVNTLREYFDSRGIPYFLGIKNDGTPFDVRKELNPDILFYPQPYSGYYVDKLSHNKFWDKLVCYTPYAFWTSKGAWSYALVLHQMAWKLFYSTDLHRKDAVKYSPRKDFNVEVVGYPTADDFLLSRHLDKWKPQSINKKRIIWAPHFTVFSGGLLAQSNFLWMADFMIDLAKKYVNQIQFIFKPHPGLYTQLCSHPDWGELKANEYYNLWKTMDNTQIETGEFVDLFMTSDAMIHDCGSFTVEYHYSENPVMYVATDIEKQLEDKNDFGKLAMHQHYIGKNREDIIAFIENVVLNGNDPMSESRKKFKENYLIPPHGKSVAENIMDVFIKAFC